MLLTKREGDRIAWSDVPNDLIAWKKLLDHAQDTRTRLNRAALREEERRERWSNRVSGLVTLVMRLCLQCGNTMRQEMLRAARHRPRTVEELCHGGGGQNFVASFGR